MTDSEAPSRRARKVTAMVVDDSAFFRKRLVAMLEQDGRIDVVAEAENGAQAVTLNTTRRPAVIVMDVNMPVMDGITAVREIMSKRPTAIIMFSAVTREGARESLDAIEAGALDFMPKNLAQGAHAYESVAKALCDRVVALAANPPARARPTVRARAGGRHVGSDPAHVRAVPGTGNAARSTPAHVVNTRSGDSNVALPSGTRLVLIGASTGGPVALQSVVTALPANYPCPVVIAQHMPDRFTAEFAKRLDATAAVRVVEAADGDELKSGTVYICRGGQQTELRRGGGVGRLAMRPPASGEIYAPSVDILFASAASLGADKFLALVLTGMGADGCEGAKRLKQAGARIWAQDEASSVVYGMPQAVARAGVLEHVLPLSDIGPALARIPSAA